MNLDHYFADAQKRAELGYWIVVASIVGGIAVMSYLNASAHFLLFASIFYGTIPFVSALLARRGSRVAWIVGFVFSLWNGSSIVIMTLLFLFWGGPLGVSPGLYASSFFILLYVVGAIMMWPPSKEKPSGSALTGSGNTLSE